MIVKYRYFAIENPELFLHLHSLQYYSYILWFYLYFTNLNIAETKELQYQKS